MVIERALKYVEGESDLSLAGVGGAQTERIDVANLKACLSGSAYAFSVIFLSLKFCINYSLCFIRVALFLMNFKNKYSLWTTDWLFRC